MNIIIILYIIIIILNSLQDKINDLTMQLVERDRRIDDLTEQNRVWYIRWYIRWCIYDLIIININSLLLYVCFHQAINFACWQHAINASENRYAVRNAYINISFHFSTYAFTQTKRFRVKKKHIYRYIQNITKHNKFNFFKLISLNHLWYFFYMILFVCSNFI